ncbi:Leucine-rich repeat domain containing protein [Parasponia andersonii]|uniref:Leucine-rich repeat domain containing protein n=1 Tax=Parasponia andersonii TaxID=3476 RepID=A0A2P5C3H0_PARAD|nr:Leucine-rich repeat domain containing protein [Parasponia andersonii]
MSANHIECFFLVLFLSFANRDTQGLCIEGEKKALLSFKQDLIDPSNKLSSWVAEKDCCEWAGIVCDSITGHVMELHLGSTTQDPLSSLSGKISPSLLGIKHLSYLNLSNSCFVGIQVPSFLGSLVSLRYLELTEAGFSGLIPPQLGNLSNLAHLGIGDNIGLYAQNLSWISGLHSLDYLDISHVNLSEASDWLSAINKLTSLSELHLSYCGLKKIHPLSYVNFTSLSVLDISPNNLHSFLPTWVSNLSSLVSLDLSQSYLEGPFPNFSWSTTSLRSLDVSESNLNSTIPSSLYGLPNLENLNLRMNNFRGVMPNAIENLTFIVTLDLAYNALEGQLPAGMRNLCNMEQINLAGNKFGGKVSEAFDSLSGCISDRLMSLDLGQNSYSGQIMDRNLDFKNLISLCLWINEISGPIPVSLGNLSRLKRLWISRNKLTGSLPDSLGSLSNLEELQIDGNLLEGVVTEVHFANLKNLKRIFASGNSLTLRVDPNWMPPFLLTFLDLSSWNLGPKFPLWLKSQKNLDRIDLSYTGISDTVPSWFWKLSFSDIYLRSNKLKSPVPSISPNVVALDLSDNYLSGNISHFLCHLIDGEISSLRSLYLGGNLLSGDISDCWMHSPSLSVIDLRNNNLSGKIPESIGSLYGLTFLHLRNNSLSGTIPSTLENCRVLLILDLGLNKLVGSVPKWIGGSLSSLMVLILHSNKLNGQIPAELCLLTERLQILDFGDNNLFGSIPSCFSDFKRMATKPNVIMNIGLYRLESAYVVIKGKENKYESILSLVISLDLSSNNLSGEIPEQLTSLQGLISLNLSGNNLRGSIPDKIGNMTWLESLDLSRNRLSGKIPPSISNLNYLSHLNLANNNLSGEIPTSTQLQSMNASSFTGNNLCGPPLSKCRTGDEKGGGMQNEEEDFGKGEEYWFRLGIAMGFAVGFLGVICPLIFFGAWRLAYFWFVDKTRVKISDFFFNFKYMLINKFSRDNN